MNAQATSDPANLREIVQAKYGEAARSVLQGTTSAAACCGGGCGGGGSDPRATDPITADLYDVAQTSGLPAEAMLASLGCGNPTMLASLAPGETVLDLGSGGGIDVLLSARRVGPAGKAYGLDMTDDMLALARENQRKAGVANVEFLKGEIEAIPLPEGAVDVVISNCVINLSTDKRQALAEAFRVLRPGGRFAVSDVVVRGAMPEAVRKSVELWIGCVAGALEEGEYRRLLAEVGFEAIEIEPTRIYRAEDAREFFAGTGMDGDAAALEMEGKVMSAFVRANKPRPKAGLQTGAGTRRVEWEPPAAMGRPARPEGRP
jgi:SAM-dependent methyltransferase